ncbi:ORF4 [Beet western yellows virus associated RNA]|uniref:ORF4 n=1 Tax=Beet western yellows virus associated RNA TaxID=1425367 RepID=A0A0A0P5P8_9VIRU|nr:ORF4 [Beet western yellows virus associated RNA]
MVDRTRHYTCCASGQNPTTRQPTTHDLR